MVWVPILALGLFAMLTAILVLRLPRQGWMLFGAVLMFGLAGYGLHGAPGQPSAPKAAKDKTVQSGEELVAARRALFDDGKQPPDYIVLSDGFARKGQYDDAAALLRQGVNRNPGDAEGWLALANALVEHAEGQLTPPALYAYQRAQDAFPAHPGAGYFLGMSYLRSGEPEEARKVWAELLERSPEDAPWREDLTFRIASLDELIAQMEGMRQLMEAQRDAPPAPMPERGP
ncbi:tetratricopeptide repeat protein [Altererythrobacter sp. BO-6]|uniref:tetratricopeptide repeat protein n=1 Tax=Altererythrobacter sp. BO-6 TaxID=2604537 RepID=UPI0013E1CC99|nr:tetratricopeptide repeat protein [Altererythrobacter sp. BO-6]QIG55313.1 tetratricopeptide repeat protein [Altererythrobacter sp. BO-6]